MMTKLWLKDVSERTSTRDLELLFGKYGDVLNVYLHSDSSKATVEMADKESALAAIKATRGAGPPRQTHRVHPAP